MLAQLLADSAQSEKVLIWTLILTSFGSLATGIFAIVKQSLSDRQAVKLREQDRLDAESRARITSMEGAAREKRLAEKIDENTKVNAAALEAANGVNAKIEKHAATSSEAVSALAKIAEAAVTAKAEGKTLFQEDEAPPEDGA